MYVCICRQLISEESFEPSNTDHGVHNNNISANFDPGGEGANKIIATDDSNKEDDDEDLPSISYFSLVRFLNYLHTHNSFMILCKTFFQYSFVLHRVVRNSC